MSLPAIGNRVRLPYLLALALGSFLALSACGGGSSSATPTITISPTQSAVPVMNGTAQFIATVNNSSSGVVWEVNGIANGNLTVGTIQNDAVNPLQGDYAAPMSVPASNPVTVTAVLRSNSHIISNPASVSITAASGLTVTPSSTTAIANIPVPFTAYLNGAVDMNVTWSVTSNLGGNVGSIGSSGSYIPPLFPPPGGQVTVKAVDGTNVGTATVTVAYGLASLNGTYAFAYTGDDGSGFFTVAGSFTADGNGFIENGGVEDAEDLGGVSSAIPISGTTYTVGGDGRANIILNAGGNSVTLEAALTTNQHGLLIRYDNNATGSGTIDQQNTADFNVNGPYVFTFAGADGLFGPLGVAGRFTAGSLSIPNVNAIADVNDAGYVNNGNGPAVPDTSLSGSYCFDQNNTASGRGLLYLYAADFASFIPTTTQPSCAGAPPAQLEFAFYVVDHTHLHLVEIDGNAFTSGDIFEGLPGPFPEFPLPKVNTAFTLGGTSTSGPYAAGGVFASDGDGNVSGGVFANNSAGTINKALTINRCPYSTVNGPNTGRIDLSLAFTSGCTTGTPKLDEFAFYQTALAQPSAVMVEIDNNFVTNGVGYTQQQTPVAPTGSFAFNLTGQGVFKNTPGSYQQDALAQLSLTGTAVTSGNFNINNYGNVQPGTVLPAQSALPGVSGTFGQGTPFKLSVSIPGTGTAVYNLTYFYVDPSTYLLLDLDTNRVANGVIADQF